MADEKRKAHEKKTGGVDSAKEQRVSPAERRAESRRRSVEKAEARAAKAAERRGLKKLTGLDRDGTIMTNGLSLRLVRRVGAFHIH